MPTVRFPTPPAGVLALLAALGAAGCAGGPGARVLRFSIVASGKPAGSETQTYGSDGSVAVDYSFNDRGRGPEIKARYRFGADDLPEAVEVKGVNYLKAPVDEILELRGGGLAWRSASEQGRSAVRGFYASNDGAFLVEGAALARAAASRSGVVPLLPAGAARVEVVAETTVSSGGRPVHLREVAITGFGFAPATFWVDDQGDPFASPSKWMAWLRAGWEEVNDALVELQTQVEERRFASLAQTLARRPAGPLAIEHVRLFDAEGAAVLEDQTVVVRGTRIEAVGSAAQTSVPADAERVDGRGRTLLPGLFDMHVHLAADDGILHLAAGVTTVRDLGNDLELPQRLARQWESGAALGPRVFRAGIIDGRGPKQVPAGLFADTVAEAEAAVDRYAAAGVVQIKLYSSLKPELVPAIVARARRHGLRVSGHVPQGMVAADFVRAGADELQHINFVFLNFLGGVVQDTRGMDRFLGVAAHAHEIDLESPQVRDFISLLLERKTAVDVTLVAFEGWFTARPGQVSPDLLPVADRLPVQVRRGFLGGGLPVTPETDRRNLDAYAAFLRMTRKLYEAGVPVLVGTDATPGLTLHRELELQVRAGIPPERVLQDATWLAARVLKQEGELGSVRVGKRADLLLVEGDPTRAIGDVRRGRLVVKDGVVFDPARLFAAVGVAPAP